MPATQLKPIDIGDRYFKAEGHPYIYEAKQPLLDKGYSEDKIQLVDTLMSVKDVAKELETRLSEDPELKEFCFEWFGPASGKENAMMPVNTNLYVVVGRGNSEGYIISLASLKRNLRERTTKFETLINGKTFNKELITSVQAKFTRWLNLL